MWLLFLLCIVSQQCFSDTNIYQKEIERVLGQLNFDYSHVSDINSSPYKNVLNILDDMLWHEEWQELITNITLKMVESRKDRNVACGYKYSDFYTIISKEEYERYKNIDNMNKQLIHSPKLLSFYRKLSALGFDTAMTTECIGESGIRILYEDESSTIRTYRKPILMVKWDAAYPEQTGYNVVNIGENLYTYENYNQNQYC